MVMEEVTTKVGHRGDVENSGGGGSLVLGVNNNNVNVNSGGDGSLGGGGNGGGNNNGGSTPAGPSSNFYVIGLEFVRQYYTVLHQGPLYLHRFYSEDSSFVHDDSRVVYGQGDIRERIQQLNFRNCVAKILQVDSHETLGNGVVIQVRGELSNNGQPMRRFMQTFVLAPQTPKRYYVRNDIFHYQDEAMPKEDLKASSPVESTLTQEDPEEKSDEEIDLTEDLSLPNTVHSNEDVGGEHVAEIALSVSRDEMTNPAPSASPPLAEVSLLDSKVDVVLKPEIEPRKTSHGFLVSGEDDSNVSGAGRGPPPAKEPQDQAQGGNSASAGGTAKTYANLFKSSSQQQQFPAQINRNPFPPPPTTKEPVTSPGASTTEPAGSDGGNLRSPPTVSPQPPTYDSTSSGRGLPPRGQYGMGYRGSTYRGDRRDNRERLTSRSSTTMNDDTGSIDGDGRRPINTYPDSQQLFVGNLPHTVTAGEIKEIFAVYGKVADVKILRPNQKKAGTTVPYFSFVVFEEASAAQAAIQEKSKITMKMPDGSNRRLNVEEKHARGDGSDNRSFTSGGGNTSGGYFPRGDSTPNIPGSGQGVSGGGGGGGNKSYVPRGGGNQGRTGGSGGDAGGGGNNSGRGGGSGGTGGDHRGHPLRTHTRTFRGSNRGGGGERGGGGGGGGGGGTGAR